MPGPCCTTITTHRGTSKSLSTYYGIFSIPATFLVGKDGNVVAIAVRGPQLGKELEKLLGARRRRRTRRRAARRRRSSRRKADRKLAGLAEDPESPKLRKLELKFVRSFALSSF